MTTMTTEPATPLTAEALSEQLFGAAIGAVELATVHLGLQLGLYEALRDVAATPTELAGLASIDERYAREWLEQQAVAQLISCEDPRLPADERRYTLPAASATVLLDANTPYYLGPLAHLAIGTMRATRDLEHAFRTGGGVAFARYGEEVRHGLGRLNGATFDRELPSWFAAMPDLEAQLQTARTPRILDMGCGTGRSSLALARHFPGAEVRGIDLDPASVDDARHAAAAEGLADRVTFVTGDAARLDGHEQYDLVIMLEALHDMGDPVGALRAARRLLRDGGAVLIADQLTRDEFVPDGDPMERFQYGCSVLHCLPATRAEEHAVAHGTVIRAATVDAWAREAGFSGTEVVAIDDPFWRFYRL